MAAAVKLSSAGALTWVSKQLDTNAQMNDLELASDGLVLVGHQYGKQDEADGWNCWFEPCGTIKGHMMKLDNDGKLEWTQDYGNYPGGVDQFTGLSKGNWGLIYNECWGVAKKYSYSADGTIKTHDGYVMACGTGIEGCSAFSFQTPWTWLECEFDPRKVWRSLAVATDLKGERVYSRMDNFQDAEQLGTVVDSAAEFIFERAAGGHTIVTDERMGFGFETIKKYDGTLCTATDEFATKLTMSLSSALMMYLMY